MSRFEAIELQLVVIVCQCGQICIFSSQVPGSFVIFETLFDKNELGELIFIFLLYNFSSDFLKLILYIHTTWDTSVLDGTQTISKHSTSPSYKFRHNSSKAQHTAELKLKLAIERKGRQVKCRRRPRGKEFRRVVEYVMS